MSPTLNPRRIPGSEFGVEIDLDPTVALSEDDQLELNRLFTEHSLLLLRGQRMSFEDQNRLVRYLGPVIDQPDKALISNVEPGGLLYNEEIVWHSDLLFTEGPYDGISLYGLEVTSGESATSFASSIRAL